MIPRIVAMLVWMGMCLLALHEPNEGSPGPWTLATLVTAPLVIVYTVAGMVRAIRAARRRPAKPKTDSGFRVRLSPSFSEHLDRCERAGMTETQAIRAWRRVQR